MVAAIGALAGSALLRRVTDQNKVQQFTALMRTKLAGKGYRKLYTWTTDGRSNASFHQRCDNQVRAFARSFLFCFLTLQGRGPRWSSCARRMGSPLAVTRLQPGTILAVPFQLPAALCSGLKILKAVLPDALTA